MLIIGLLAAVCLYVLLYWVYIAAEAKLSGATSTLSVLHQIFVMPDESIFVLLRGLIIVVLFYIIADAVLTPARRSLKNARQRRLDAQREARAFHGVRAPQQNKNDEDDSLNLAH